MAHDVPNLGVIDGSTFVTSGGVNPTSSICALALRAVDHLLAHRADVPSPDHRHSVHFAAPAARSGQPVTVGHPSKSRAAVDDAVRSRLARVAHVLIPAADAMPSANEVGVTQALLDRVLAAVPSLAGSLTAALDSDLAEEDVGPWLDGLAAHDRATFGSLALAVAGAYYLDPGVRLRLGYEGQVPQPVRAAAFPEYVDEGLLDPVLANWAR
jgi:hypothetical protein